MAPANPDILELEPAAAAMLDLLVELGHLDEGMLQAVNDRLLDLTPSGGADAHPVHPIDVAALKRVAAQVISEHLDATDPEYQRALEREWPLLFH